MKINNDAMDYMNNAYIDAPIMQRNDKLRDKQIKLEDELSKSLTDWQKKLFQNIKMYLKICITEIAKNILRLAISAE